MIKLNVDITIFLNIFIKNIFTVSKLKKKILIFETLFPEFKIFIKNIKEKKIHKNKMKIYKKKK